MLHADFHYELTPESGFYFVYTGFGQAQGRIPYTLAMRENAIMFKREMDAENPMTTATDIIH